ncbi:MAG: hypothetical protein OEP95_07460 [Myxococcales bacterium]|nr:hypothetical protein [Myxococcales bacterium]
MLPRALDALLFSSLWVSLAAVALTAASAQAQGVPALRVAVLAGCATFVVYGVDRLRDLERDLRTAPARSAFVSAHERPLRCAAGLAGAAAGAIAVTLPWQTLLAPAAAAPLAFFHRRLKRFELAKASYVTAAWVAITVGMPAGLGGALHSAWVAGAIALAVFANAIASNVRDAEAGAARFGTRRVLQLAYASAAAATLLPLFGPDPVRPLAAIGALTGLALVGFRPSERYGLGIVDGALVLGGLAAFALA